MVVCANACKYYSDPLSTEAIAEDCSQPTRRASESFVTSFMQMSVSHDAAFVRNAQTLPSHPTSLRAEGVRSLTFPSGSPIYFPSPSFDAPMMPHPPPEQPSKATCLRPSATHGVFHGASAPSFSFSTIRARSVWTSANRNRLLRPRPQSASCTLSPFRARSLSRSLALCPF